MSVGTKKSSSSSWINLTSVESWEVVRGLAPNGPHKRKCAPPTRRTSLHLGKVNMRDLLCNRYDFDVFGCPLEDKEHNNDNIAQSTVIFINPGQNLKSRDTPLPKGLALIGIEKPIRVYVVSITNMLPGLPAQQNYRVLWIKPSLIAKCWFAAHRIIQGKITPIWRHCLARNMWGGMKMSICK